MANPAARKELKKTILSSGVSAEMFENEGTLTEMMAFSFLNFACNIDKFLPNVGLFFICRRASQPDTTFEIASERDLKKKKNKLKSPASSKGEKKRQLKA
ncbi:hypothetical protein TYRP_018527 [Tyrophagus putrescentiae]|nr:hypothetical protein TYRP_018527 [Tyrophagus putrescentiae]